MEANGTGGDMEALKRVVGGGPAVEKGLCEEGRQARQEAGRVGGGGEIVVGRSSVVQDYREYRGYGEWTVVQRRRPRMQSNFQNPKMNVNGGFDRLPLGKNRVEKGDENIMRFAATSGTNTRQGGGKVKNAVNKPMLVYKRGGKLHVVGSPGTGSRTKSGSLAEGGGKQPAADIGGSSGQVDKGGGFVGGSLSPPMDDGVRKRRRGVESSHGGGRRLPIGDFMKPILWWNCRGARSKKMGNFLRSLIADHRAVLVGLLETKVERFSRAQVD